MEPLRGSTPPAIKLGGAQRSRANESASYDERPPGAKGHHDRSQDEQIEREDYHEIDTTAHHVEDIETLTDKKIQSDTLPSVRLTKLRVRANSQVTMLSS